MESQPWQPPYPPPAKRGLGAGTIIALVFGGLMFVLCAGAFGLTWLAGRLPSAPARAETPQERQAREEEDRKAVAAKKEAVAAARAQRWDALDGQIDAFVMSQKFVKKQLKAPSSARFPYITDPEVHAKHLGSGKFRVVAYVDSQNAFGVMMRNHYTCDLQSNDDNTWSLLNLTTK